MLTRRIEGPRGVGIKGLGFYVPERVVTNDELARVVDTSDEWITQKLGIKTRRYAAPDQASSDLGVAAARAALLDAGVRAEALDLVIVASINPDHRDPAPASLVQHAIGAVNAAAFSLAVGGCPDSIFALVAASQFVLSGACRTVLVVCADVLTRGLIDPRDRRSCVIFGDGAGAMVLGAVKPGVGLCGYALANDGAQYHAVRAEAGGSRRPIDAAALAEGAEYVRMDARQVFDFGVKALPDSIRHALAVTGRSIEELDLVVCHQASLHLIRQGIANLGLPMTKTFVNVDRYGNTGGASMPIALAEAVQEGRVRPGQTIALAAFGAGLAWGAGIVRWPAPEDFL